MATWKHVSSYIIISGFIFFSTLQITYSSEKEKELKIKETHKQLLFDEKLKACVKINNTIHDIVKDTYRRIEKIEWIRQDHVNSAPYEFGYLNQVIMEKYRKMLDRYNISMDLKGKFFVAELIMNLEEIELLYWDIDHLTSMVHEIERKYTIETPIDTIYPDYTAQELKDIKSGKRTRGRGNPQRNSTRRTADPKWLTYVPGKIDYYTTRSKKKKEFKLNRYILDKLLSTPPKRRPKHWPLEYGWDIGDNFN